VNCDFKAPLLTYLLTYLEAHTT